MEKFMVKDLILDLRPIPSQFLIHSLPLLSIPEGNDSIEVIMG